MRLTEEMMESYCRIVEQYVFADDVFAAEHALAEAFELGRRLVVDMVSPEDVSGLHHEAVVRLARAHPNLTLGQVAEQLTRPLLEMSMAYGLSFREQMAQRFEATVNARLEQSSKLEALGLLAAGIAHDFNNILGSILGFAELTGEALADGSREKENIGQVQIACVRARNLVERMLAFARQTPAEPVRLDLVAQVKDSLSMLSASLDARIEITFQHCMESAWVMGSPGQIQQIVMNLCINAADAMQGSGRLDIRLQPAADIVQESAGHAMGYCLTVADTGCGMPPEIQARVFDPFFTTKAPNGGSGLGLSVVYGIVKDLGGTIDLNSRSTGAQTGTEFRILLPSASPG